MDAPTDIAQIAHSIQLSLAPVFLLSGIVQLLGVLTNRLARAVDRARTLEDQHRLANHIDAPDLAYQLELLAKRARLLNGAITLGTVAALVISLIVALLFASAFISFTLAVPVAALFVSAMRTLVVGLICFLVEVRVATFALRIGPKEKNP